jgi:RNA polymerase sigma factor (TIGR02999 family)
MLQETFCSKALYHLMRKARAHGAKSKSQKRQFLFVGMGISGKNICGWFSRGWRICVESERGQVTDLLNRFREGDAHAEAQLIPLVYDELRRLASRYLNRERGDHTLQPTALVHEAFIRMVNEDQPPWQNRAHFFGVAARLMRQILVDHARRRQSLKRGGSRERTDLDEEFTVYSPEKSAELLALDEALDRLAQQDERQSRVVEMKYFVGLDIDDIAKVLDISPRTVKRDWTMAKAWLHQEMTR